MQFSKKEQWTIFLTVNALLLVGILLFPLYRQYAPMLPLSKCGLLEYLHLYCPACGGTRALNALLHFDLVASLAYNPMVLLAFLLLLTYEVAMVRHLLKEGTRTLFLKPWMVYVTIGIWTVYTILRNVLLIWGIDPVGNVIPPV